MLSLSVFILGLMKSRKSGGENETGQMVRTQVVNHLLTAGPVDKQGLFGFILSPLSSEVRTLLLQEGLMTRFRDGQRVLPAHTFSKSSSLK